MKAMIYGALFLSGYFVLTKTKLGTSIISTIGQTTKSPATPTPARVDNGVTANQPWYLGPVNTAVGAVAGASTSALISASASTLAALSSTANTWFGSQPDSSGSIVDQQVNGVDNSAVSGSDSNSNTEVYPVDQSNADMSSSDMVA